MTASLDDYRWLLSEAAGKWLAAVAEGGGSQVQHAAKLRKELSMERVHLVLEQGELRRRGREKFTRAAEMFFTRLGLEQATDEQLASYKSQRFGAAGRIADLCCGIGGDLLGLAAVGPVTGVERDAVAAMLARANANLHGWTFERAQVAIGDVRRFSLEEIAAWHIDPDRRPQGRRTTRVELYEPSRQTIEAMLQRNAQAAIKLAPAAETPPEWNAVAERQWLGSRGECRQQVAWFGSLARDVGQRSATIVDAVGGPRTVSGDADDLLPAVTSLGTFLYEPHPAILAAKLTKTLCLEHGLAAVSPRIAYLTSEHSRPVHDPALAAFEVRDVLPLDRKRLKAYCNQHRLGRLEIKKRGIDIDPQQLRKEVAVQGDAAATLIIAPIGGRTRVIVARRLYAPVDADDGAA